MLYPDTTTSDVQAVTITAATMTPAFATTETWMFVSSTDCYIAQGAAPTATAADGSMFVPAGVIITLSGKAGAKVSVIRATVDGTCSLTRVL